MLSSLPQKTILVAGSIVLLTVALVPSLYFYSKYQTAQKMLSDPQKMVSSQNRELLAKIGKLMILPIDEEPTIATVSDKDKLKNQPFFEKSQNGDKVLIYQKSKKLILFRPSLEKIVDVSQINLNNEQATTSASPSAQTITSYKVVILNGTKTIGLTKTAESRLVKESKKYQVANRDDAKKKDYPKTLVVDLTGKENTAQNELAQLLGGEAAALPKEETAPKDVDFLVILGQDFIGR